MKRQITVPEYLRSRDNYYQKKQEKELIGIIVFGFFIALMAVFGFSWLVMKMVEKGWIN